MAHQFKNAYELLPYSFVFFSSQLLEHVLGEDIGVLLNEPLEYRA